MAKVNLVPAKFHPYLIDLNPAIAYSKPIQAINGREKEINRIYNCLLSERKSKVILLGEHGVGKTATVNKLIYNVCKRKQCPEQLKNCHFLYFDIELLINQLSNRSVQKKLKSIIDFICSYNNLVLVIDMVHLVQADPLLSYYFSNLVKQPCVKIIGMSTEEEFDNFFAVYDSRSKAHLETINILEPRLSQLYPMIVNQVKLMANTYNIKISKRLIQYAINVSTVLYSDLSNPEVTLDIIEKAMIVARRKHYQEVTRETINANFNFRYDFYKRLSDEDKKLTAYHEAGHFLVNYFSENIQNLKTNAMSIVPAEDFLGITLFDFEYEKQTSLNKDYFIDNIAVDLAGRAAETIILGDNSEDYTSGASADLKHATSIARTIVTEYGMTKDFAENMTFFTGDISDLYLLSNVSKQKIEKEVTKLVNEAYKRAKELLDDNKAVLERLADELLKNDVLDEIDLKQICNSEADKKMKLERKAYRQKNKNI